jgi:hypothetical protein
MQTPVLVPVSVQAPSLVRSPPCPLCEAPQNSGEVRALDLEDG